MPEQVTPALGGAYPKEPDNSAKLEAQIKELMEQNKTLQDKVKQAETDRIRQLAGQVADKKIGKKMLTKEKRDDEIAKLSKYTEETLRALDEELSAMPVTLTDVPAPVAPPTVIPAQLSAEQKQAEDMKQMRLQLFGHEEPADLYYKKLSEGKQAKRSW